MSGESMDQASATGASSSSAEPTRAQELMAKFISKNPENTFASLFRDNRLPEENCLLKFVPISEGPISLSFDEVENVKILGPCLVGCVVGRKLNGYVVKEFVRQWGSKVRIEIHDSGWIMFFFSNEDEMKRVLEGGPYLVFGRHLFLKELPPCFLFRVEDMLMLPSWVQIHGLPADCWTTKSLSKIASVLGKPIHTDILTMSKGKSLFARVLVEMDSSKPRIYEYPIMLPNGILTNVRFVYETELKYCSKCNSLGHSFEQCQWFKGPAGEDANANEDPTKTKDVGDQRVHRSRSRGPGQRGGMGHGPGFGGGGRGPRFGGGGRGLAGGVVAPVATLGDNEGTGYNIVREGELEGGNKQDDCVDEDGIIFEVPDANGNGKITVEVFEGGSDEEGFETVVSKRNKKAIKYLKRLTKDFPSLLCVWLELDGGQKTSLGFLLHRGDAIDLPWILMGDFNCVRHPYEKKGGVPVAPREMADLRNCIARLELSDVNHVGCYFTWFSLVVSYKLDRVMVNYHWTESNLDVFVDFVAPGCFSDHSCNVITIFRDHSRRASPFKFFNMWATHQDFQVIVRDNWFYGGGGGGGTAQFIIKKMLNGMKRVLKQLNDMHFSHISGREKNANEEIVEAQNRALNGDGVDNSIVELRRRAEFLLEAERLFLSQKAKCEYLKHSDRCSKFFHGMIKRNIKRNKIVALTLRDGSISVNPNEIAEDFVGFYRNLLGVATNREALDESIIPLGPSLPDSSWGEMMRMVSVDD
ncbi:uncharacterized protein [Henckelia pumila]|uniref:uncharacterized protein n=1 Tax=Henckelia pumila TaxID=405737 RepID=UPI003C6E5AD5